MRAVLQIEMQTKSAFRLIFVATVFLAQIPLAAREFVHPGMYQSHEDLEFMKRKVLTGEQPWKGAWDRLLKNSYSSTDFDPKPTAHVIRGAYGRPSIGSNELMASAKAAYSQALQWYVTGDKAHARKAIQIIDAWAPVLQDLKQNDAKLLVGWTGHDFLNAAEILRYTDSGWEDKDTELLRRMMMGVYYPLIKDFFPEANGNWDAAIMDTMLCTGVFFDDHAIFDRAVDHYLHGHLNGGITHYVYPSGQCQESTRDMGHTQLGLGEMAQACQVAWTQGVDLFGAAGNRLALGFEYTARYNLGEDVPCEGFISNVSSGRFSDIYYLVYQHYGFDRGIDMPYTARAVEKTVPRSLSVLTMFRGADPTPPPPKMGPPKPSTIAAQGGAMPEPGAKPPASAIVIAPGQSIQNAIDHLHGSPGWIVLAKGVHQLPAALHLSSGVTLAGQGDATILWLDPKASGPAIVNSDQSLSDVTIRDLVIEGAVTSRPHNDPNADRRTRSRPGAPRRGGIASFVADDARPFSNLRLEHITVRNCTDTGVRIDGAIALIIVACSFTDDGNLADTHDLSLANLTHCTITDSRLNNSPTGDGVHLSHCEAVTIVNNEIARNVGHAIGSGESSHAHAEGNLTEGNEADLATPGGLQSPAHN
jgi:hypothetical protein